MTYIATMHRICPLLPASRYADRLMLAGSVKAGRTTPAHPEPARTNAADRGRSQ